MTPSELAGRRVEVYSVRRPGASPGDPPGGYARCLDCPWFVATVDLPSAVRAAEDHHRAGCAP